MTTNRLEAFSDGVLAIIITIMVLEMQVPHGDTQESLLPLLPIFLSYVLSFIYIATYWNNHHHLFQVSTQVSAKILWANMNLLFWISLIPFTTAWMGENYSSSLPVALYGVVLLMAGISYHILSSVLISQHGSKSVLATSIGRNVKGKMSILIYFVAIIVAFYFYQLALTLYALVLVYWLIPERKIETSSR